MAGLSSNAKSNTPEADIELKNPEAFLRKMSRASDVGVAESYMDGDWTSNDVTAFFAAVHRQSPSGWG